MNQFNKKQIVIGGAILAAIVIGLSAFFFVRGGFSGPAAVPMVGEPTDVVKDFYQAWLDARLSSTTDPYKEGLQNSLVLAPEVRKQIKEGKDGAVDAVLCQPVVPPEFSTRTVSATAERVEVLVMARPSGPPEQAIITLTAQDGGWYISGIRCSPGEVPPEREFSFDNTGFLMKNVPPPLDATRWYLIFSENGEDGHYAPLDFSADSMCKSGGSEAPCDPSAFREQAEAHVQGELTETGVKVKKVEILNQ